MQTSESQGCIKVAVYRRGGCERDLCSEALDTCLWSDEKQKEESMCIVLAQIKPIITFCYGGAQGRGICFCTFLKYGFIMKNQS